MGLSGFNKARREAKPVVITETEATTEELTKAQIVEQLKAKGVDFDARQNKETLLVLLKAGE